MFVPAHNSQAHNSHVRKCPAVKAQRAQHWPEPGRTTAVLQLQLAFCSEQLPQIGRFSLRGVLEDSCVTGGVQQYQQYPCASEGFPLILASLRAHLVANIALHGKTFGISTMFDWQYKSVTQCTAKDKTRHWRPAGSNLVLTGLSSTLRGQRCTSQLCDMTRYMRAWRTVISGPPSSWNGSQGRRSSSQFDS